MSELTPIEDLVKGHVIPGLFRNKESAEAAIEGLRERGFVDEQIGMIIPNPGHYQEEAHYGSDEAKSIAIGGAIGAPIGTIAGLAISAVAIGAGGPLGAGGLLVGAIGGAMWGGFFGTEAGMLARVRWDPDQDTWCDIEMGGTDILVIVEADDPVLIDRAKHVMEQNGAQCFLAGIPPEMIG
jgi:hypothetical protein